MEAQTLNIGCHACGRLECHTQHPNCHSKCSADRHVCVFSDDGSSCDSCGRFCHRTNADERCLFHKRARGQVTWTANTQQLLDTQAGTQGMIPHMSQLPWKFLDTARSQLLVDGIAYRKGYGDPGAAEHGEWNNCLIDSLRQCLGGVQCDRRVVRKELQAQYGNGFQQDPRSVVTADSYLDVELHWAAILRSILRHNTSGLTRSFDPTIFVWWR